jgi:hypothetical protein
VQEQREVEARWMNHPREERKKNAEMKPDSAPGPDGLPVVFFKKFLGDSERTHSQHPERFHSRES